MSSKVFPDLGPILSALPEEQKQSILRLMVVTIEETQKEYAFRLRVSGIICWVLLVAGFAIGYVVAFLQFGV